MQKFPKQWNNNKKEKADVKVSEVYCIHSDVRHLNYVVNVGVIGSLGFDFIMNFSGRFTDRIVEDKIQKISLSFLVDSLNKQLGGTGGNIAFSLKLLGIEPFILACTGNDFISYKRFLRTHKISTKYIKEFKDESTSSYFVVTDTANNQIGSFYVGAMKHASTLHISSVTTPLNFVVIAPTDPQAMKNAVEDCIITHIPFLYDPAFQIATFAPEELLMGIKNATIVIGNDYEISLIEQKLEISHEELVAMVPILITTLGDKGSIIETRSQSIHVKPAKPKGVVDPTGCGDAYRSGFLAGYLRNFPLDVCGQMGSVASVYTVELFGTQTHMYTKKAFIRRYEENFQGTITL